MPFTIASFGGVLIPGSFTASLPLQNLPGPKKEKNRLLVFEPLRKSQGYTVDGARSSKPTGMLKPVLNNGNWWDLTRSVGEGYCSSIRFQFKVLREKFLKCGESKLTWSDCQYPKSWCYKPWPCEHQNTAYLVYIGIILHSHIGISMLLMCFWDLLTCRLSSWKTTLEQLTCHPRCVELRNLVAKRGALAMAEALRCNDVLESLDMNSNEVGERGPDFRVFDENFQEFFCVTLWWLWWTNIGMENPPFLIGNTSSIRVHFLLPCWFTRVFQVSWPKIASRCRRVGRGFASKQHLRHLRSWKQPESKTQISGWILSRWKESVILFNKDL